jgi:hypothetical protein
VDVAGPAPPGLPQASKLSQGLPQAARKQAARKLSTRQHAARKQGCQHAVGKQAAASKLPQAVRKHAVRKQAASTLSARPVAARPALVFASRRSRASSCRLGLGGLQIPVSLRPVSYTTCEVQYILNCIMHPALSCTAVAASRLGY